MDDAIYSCTSSCASNYFSIRFLSIKRWPQHGFVVRWTFFYRNLLVLGTLYSLFNLNFDTIEDKLYALRATATFITIMT